MTFGIKDRVKSVLDNRVYRVSAMRGSLAVLRLAEPNLESEDPLLETVARLGIYYKKLSPYAADD